MASIDRIPPPTASEPPTSNVDVVAPPMAARSDSIMTADMHIPGAWNGTNPGTPSPIGDDLKRLGETLKTVPGTIQSYLPAKEQVTAGGSSILNKAASFMPAGVMNTATNMLPKSMQPTMSPTAAGANPPHPTDASDEHPIVTTTNTTGHKELGASSPDEAPGETTLTDRLAAVLPESVLDSATAHLPTSLTSQTAPSTSEAQTKDAREPSTDNETTLKNITPSDKENGEMEASSSTSWTEKAKSILPIAAVGAYLPLSLNPKASTGGDEDNVQMPVSTNGEVDLNASLPPPPKSASPAQTETIIGSSVSPDTDVQEALGRAADPQEYRHEVVLPMHAYSSAVAPPIPPKEKEASAWSTQAVGGGTPITPSSREIEGGDGYPAKNNSDVSSLSALATAGVAGSMMVDHGVNDQRAAAKQPKAGTPANRSMMGPKEVAMKQHDQPLRQDGNASRFIEQPENPFVRVVIPDRPDAGVHEQEPLDKNGEENMGQDTISSRGKLKKRDRSGSVSAEEAGPSSPSKSGIFGGIRKLTKKRDGSLTKGHDRKGSLGDAAPTIPTQSDLSDLRDSNSSEPNPADSREKGERSVLHKDPSHWLHDHYHGSTKPEGEIVSPISVNSNHGSSGSSSKREKDGTPSMPAGPTSPINSSATGAAVNSPSKVGFREKLKGEMMVVQGTLTRDHELKEAGEKRKKGMM